MAKSPFFEDQYDEILDQYAVVLGRVAHSWNHLHEALGALLARTMNLPFKTILAIWYSTNSDRAQRLMIRAALEDSDVMTSEQKKEIEWLLNKVDTLSTMRNIAIHAPCSVGIADSEMVRPGHRVRKVLIVPHYFNGNPRAHDLLGKDVIEEFKWYEARTEALKKYTQAIASALRTERPSPWPDRPLLPERGQAKKNGTGSRQGRADKGRS